jgi:hypothetical protein
MANPLEGSRRTAPSTRACPPNRWIRAPDASTNERENLKTAGVAHGLRSNANPARQHATKPATNIQGSHLAPEDTCGASTGGGPGTIGRFGFNGPLECIGSMRANSNERIAFGWHKDSRRLPKEAPGRSGSIRLVSVSKQPIAAWPGSEHCPARPRYC